MYKCIFFIVLIINYPFTLFAGDEVKLCVTGRSEKIGLQFPQNPNVFPPKGKSVWRNGFTHPGSMFMYVHLQFRKIPCSTDWILHITDSQNRIIQSIASEQFSDIQMPYSFWTNKIEGDRVGLIFCSNDNPIGLDFKIDKYIHSVPRRFILRNIIPPNDLEDIKNYKGEKIYRLSKAVTLLEINDGKKIYVCTGFLIDDDLILTNYHCIINTNAQDIKVVFNKETGKKGVTKEVIRIERSDFNRDYAILRLKRPINNVLVIKLSEAEPIDNLAIIQHPGGIEKMISIRNCRATSIPPEFYFCHQCDTEGGSSGSPVLNKDGDAIGLHQSGFNENKDQVNKAILMKYIIADLKNQIDLFHEVMK